MRFKAFLALCSLVAVGAGLCLGKFDLLIAVFYVLAISQAFAFSPSMILGAADVYGTAHLYGIGDTVSNATITDQSFEDTCANMAEVVNESGNAIERRYDDVTIEGQITLIQRSAYTMPEPGNTMTHGGVTYEIQKVGRRHTSRGHRIVELSVKKSAEITYP